MSFTSKVFETRLIKMADREESIVAGGCHLFPLLPTGRCCMDQQLSLEKSSNDLNKITST